MFSPKDHTIFVSPWSGREMVRAYHWIDAFLLIHPSFTFLPWFALSLPLYSIRANSKSAVASDSSGGPSSWQCLLVPVGQSPCSCWNQHPPSSDREAQQSSPLGMDHSHLYILSLKCPALTLQSSLAVTYFSVHPNNQCSWKSCLPPSCLLLWCFP